MVFFVLFEDVNKATSFSLLKKIRRAAVYSRQLDALVPFKLLKDAERRSCYAEGREMFEAFQTHIYCVRIHSGACVRG